MTLRNSDLQSDSDLDSIRNSCDVFDICGRQYFVPTLGFAILILPLMPQGEYKAVATEENQAFEMTVSGKNHQ